MTQIQELKGVAPVMSHTKGDSLQKPRKTRKVTSKQIPLLFLAYRQKSCQTKVTTFIIKDIL